MDAAAPQRAPNRLADETSAYLRQHMYNPVDWYPWGPEALRRARDAQRPLLVSIGYSACHWCHVMERESFEDEATAQLMNQLFVCIKVDREERPDLDQLYMDTVTGLTGHGGWPLTVFCTPDGRPFYGGTYFPPEPRHGLPSFRQLLHSVAEAYAERRDQVLDTAARITEALGQRPGGVDPGHGALPSGRDCAAQGALRLLQRADPEHGGFGTAPKFPTPPSLDLLLAARDALPERKAREAQEHVEQTCREMSRGGLFDQLGGGFHRYSVDARWCVPHFEKMLYDQGQLMRERVRRGLAARRLRGRGPAPRHVRERIFEYVLREHDFARGRLFYSSRGRGQRGRGGPLLRPGRRARWRRCWARRRPTSATPTR